MSTPMHHGLLIATIVACAVGALVDLRTGHIPNWVSLGLFGAAPLVRAAAALHLHHPPAPEHPWALAALAGFYSLASGVGSALIPLALARSGGLGLGDVKLFAAIGAACGIFVALYAQTYAYVFAMVYALALVARQGKLRSTLENVKRLLGASRSDAVATGPVRHPGFTEVKFGPAILAGMCVAAWAQWRS